MLLSGKPADAHHSADGHGFPRHASPRRFLEVPSPRLAWISSGSGSERDYVPIKDDPWYVKFLAEKFPFCQAVCTPADFATRRQRRKAEEQKERVLAAERRAKEDPGSGRTSRLKASPTGCLVAGFRFGLPDFESLEFGLVPPAEANFADGTVYRKLGLHLAIHKWKSIERLCLRYEKTRIPRSGADGVMDVVRRLLQCDHANILRCLEVAEDDTHLYFLHEHLPCVTLESALRKCQHQVWTESQKANLSREVCAALLHAVSSAGLNHLGLTLRHVLLPATESGDPKYAKVFGFGLLGTLIEDSGDRLCWPPEAHRLRITALQSKDNEWLLRLPGNLRGVWDSWSLGNIIYAIVDGRLPFRGNQAFEAERLRFPVAFDAMERSAQTLVEALLCRSPMSRIQLADAMRHDWFRSFSRKTLADSSRAFEKLHAWCSAKLANRLFGRFLTAFLDARAMRQVAQQFCAMDLDSDGLLSHHDLEVVARLAGMEEPKGAAEHVLEIFGCQSSQTLSLSRFAASLAEETIDSRGLRLAFESIDKDGSQQITPPELLQVLQSFDARLTFDEVVEHIGDVESKVAGTTSSDAQDHILEFDEFAQLFPERVAVLEMLERRSQASRARAQDLSGRFTGVRGDAEAWVRSLDAALGSLVDLKEVAVEHFRGDEVRHEALDGIQGAIRLAHDRLHSIPGPHDLAEERRRRLKAKCSPRGKHLKPCLQYGFDTFLQDHGIEWQWPDLIKEETIHVSKVMKRKQAHALVETEYLMVYDCAEAVLGKVSEVLDWTRAQAGEYEAFSEVFDGAEGTMPRISMSGRGLLQPGDGGGKACRAKAGNAATQESSSHVESWPLRCFCSRGACAEGAERPSRLWCSVAAG